ncbi:ATP-binding protein [Thermaerobacillus caldiproteolyticus]|uniref:ATP-binding protein n=1 Tax=Thermaerobacillus caldiproteolyticus TaxID=247480 RepID=UPI0018F20DB0|nr:ATP-binding protein [Anoxybacillus caldiproteolyticus]
MSERDVKIGKIIKIEGVNIQVEVIERDIATKLVQKNGVNDFIVSINKLIYCYLPNGKKIVARITKIYDKNAFITEDIFERGKEAYVIEAILLGIYDEFLNSFDTGINSFPIIGSEVYSINKDIYRSVTQINSDYKIQIGRSYNDETIQVYANPDVLFGKHLGIFGNTGTGKSCTVASIIQGLKRRVIDSKGNSVKLKPKIIIFDANNEYEKAFQNTEFSVKKITKEELRLPHYHLSYTEYYRFLGASQGVQAPVLKACIDQLRSNEESSKEFALKELPVQIKKWLSRNSLKKDPSGNPTNEIDSFKLNQWYSWCSTMINRIQNILEDERIINIIEYDSAYLYQNTVKEVLSCSEEIIIIEADFDKDESDIIIFLFAKLMYEEAIKNRENQITNSTVILFEEAHRYINEEDSREYKLGSYYIERLAREGRKFGISLIISSQRPSELSKIVVSQCNSFIIHRITNKNDIDFISRCLNSNNQDLIKYLSGLERQYAIVFGEAFGYSEIVKIETAFPTPKSEDPKVISSWLEK